MGAYLSLPGGHHVWNLDADTIDGTTLSGWAGLMIQRYGLPSVLVTTHMNGIGWSNGNTGGEYLAYYYCESARCHDGGGRSEESDEFH